MTRLVALYSGGDWNDASVDHVVVKKGLNLTQEYEQYRTWLNRDYKPGSVPFVTFKEWLIDRHKAREAGKKEIEDFWEQD